ncbi:Unannotated [Lentimonas sp. CC19]|nr:Unannotated [Lentimonas sp. CC19]
MKCLDSVFLTADLRESSLMRESGTDIAMPSPDFGELSRFTDLRPVCHIRVSRITISRS